MGLSKEKLKAIEEWAYDMQSIEQVAKIEQLDIELFQEGSEAAIAFETGQLRAYAGITRSIRKLAEAGSGPAQATALIILNGQTLKKSFE